MTSSAVTAVSADAAAGDPASIADRLRAVAAAAAGVIGADSPEALRAVLEDACRKVIPFDAFFILAFDANAHTFQGFGGHDNDLFSPPSLVPAAGTPAERVVAQRKSLLTLNSDDPDAQGAQVTGTGRRSESVIRSPILSGDEVLGILSVQSYTPDLYTEEDVEIIEVIASLAATAIVNLRLHEERKSAEAALRASEESYRTIFELSSDAAFVHDVETGAVLDANRRACDLHGCTLEELKELGIAGISEGVPPYDEEHARRYVRLAAEGKPQRFEWRVRNRAGDAFWVEVSLHRVRILGEPRVLASVRNIDERKVAEDALQRAHDELEQRVQERTSELARRTAELAVAEQRFRAIAEASPTPLVLSRIEDGVILYANDRIEQLIGAGPGDLAGRKTTEFYYDPADRARVIEAIQQKGESPELRLRRSDGSAIWVSLSVQQLEYDGQPALATSLLDITERKQTEEALRASEASYRSLFDNLTELVYVQDLEGRFINVNDAVLRAYGYSRDEFIGRTPEFLAAPGLVDTEDTMERFRRALAGEPQRFDWWGRRKDGSIFPKELVLNRSTYFGKDVVIAVGRDISERVEAEDALRRSEEHFRRLIENASDLISILDADGVIRYQSQAVKRMFGYEPDELIGRNAFDYLPEDEVAPTMARLRKAVEQPGKPVLAEFRFRHKDGSWRHVEGLGTTLSVDSANEGIVVNSRDVTERKQAEATLRFQKTLLEAQGEASIDGSLVVSDEGEILSYNQRFLEMWEIPANVMEPRSDQTAIQYVLDKLDDPNEFVDRIEYLYAHPEVKARDEITLRDGRVFDRYTAPVVSAENEYYGRIWFFRDITVQKRYAEVLDKARQEAELATEQASHYAAELERELDIGRRIQRSFIPTTLPQPSGWEIAARFRPAWRVAGDFYDVFELGDHIGLVIADVSGKGVGAALFMALFQSMLRANAERAVTLLADHPSCPEKVLLEAMTATNGYTTRVHRQTSMFASVFFGLLDPTTGVLNFVSAGHERPLVLHDGRAASRLHPTGPALGIIKDADYEVETIRIEPGDLFVAFTDGVTEARDDKRDFFTEERLLKVVAEPSDSAALLLDRIEQAVDDFEGDTPPFDDRTLLAVRRKPVSN